MDRSEFSRRWFLIEKCQYIYVIFDTINTIMKSLSLRSRHLLTIATVITIGAFGLAELTKATTLNPFQASDYTIPQTVEASDNPLDILTSGPINLIAFDKQTPSKLLDPAASLGLLWFGTVSASALLKRKQQTNRN